MSSPYDKILPNKVYKASGDPYFVPYTAVSSITVANITANSVSAPSLSGVSTINGYAQNNWWNLSNYSRGTVNNVSFPAISSGSGIIEAPGSFSQTACKGGQTYYMNIPYSCTTNAQVGDAEFFTPYVGFSTGTLRLTGGSFFGDSNLTYTHYAAFNGILDCPVDNAPLVLYGRTDTQVNQVNMSSPDTGTFQYGKIANTTN